jgi:hypothetical protein
VAAAGSEVTVSGNGDVKQEERQRLHSRKPKSRFIVSLLDSLNLCRKPESSMKNNKLGLTLLGTFCALILISQIANAQGKSAQNTAPVHLVITDAALREDAELPPLRREDVKVKQGKNFLKVTQLIPAQGDNAALQLMILIDDTLNTSVGNNLTDVKDFISAQPSSTVIGIAYMNAAVNVVQNFTADHDLAVKAVRLPRGSFSSMDSPYLSLISLVKSWPQQNVRREVLMVSDGIDRLRGEKPGPSRLGPNFGPVYHSMPTLSVDATSASEISQRYNVLVHSIYEAGVGRAGRSSWDLQLGLSGLSKLADETGGECYSLGNSPLVSFKPHLERLQKLFSNQRGIPGGAGEKGWLAARQSPDRAFEF